MEIVGMLLYDKVIFLQCPIRFFLIHCKERGLLRCVCLRYLSIYYQASSGLSFLQMPSLSLFLDLVFTFTMSKRLSPLSFSLSFPQFFLQVVLGIIFTSFQVSISKLLIFSFLPSFTTLVVLHY